MLVKTQNFYLFIYYTFILFHIYLFILWTIFWIFWCDRPCSVRTLCADFVGHGVRAESWSNIQIPLGLPLFIYNLLYCCSCDLWTQQNEKKINFKKERFFLKFFNLVWIFLYRRVLKQAPSTSSTIVLAGRGNSSFTLGRCFWLISHEEREYALGQFLARFRIKYFWLSPCTISGF